MRVRYCNPTYDWQGTGNFLGAAAPTAGEAPTGGGFRHGQYTGQPASVGTLYGGTTSGSPVVYAATQGVPYPAATGMLPEVVPAGTRTLASTCYWKNQDTVVNAPKNGAAALFASVSAIAFGAAVLAI